MVRRNERTIQIDHQEIPQTAYFCCLGSIIHRDSGIEKAVIH